MRRRPRSSFLRSVLPLFFLWCLCISEFLVVAGTGRCSVGFVPVVPPADCAWSCCDSAPGDAARRSCRGRNPGLAAVDFVACCASAMLQFVICVHGELAIVVCFCRNNKEIELVDESSDEHHMIATSILWPLEQEAVEDECYSTWCLSCAVDPRQDNKQAEGDDSHPSESIHRWRMRAPSSDPQV